MFVTFANIEEPNSLSEEEARHLHAELLTGTPSITHTQAAEKIQRGWEQTGEVNLNDDEKRVLIQTLGRRGPAGPKADLSVGFNRACVDRLGRTWTEHRASLKAGDRRLAVVLV